MSWYSSDIVESLYQCGCSNSRCYDSFRIFFHLTFAWFMVSLFSFVFVGLPAEQVGAMAAEILLRSINNEACVDEYLQDQVCFPMTTFCVVDITFWLICKRSHEMFRFVSTSRNVSISQQRFNECLTCMPCDILEETLHHSLTLLSFLLLANALVTLSCRISSSRRKQDLGFRKVTVSLPSDLSFQKNLAFRPAAFFLHSVDLSELNRELRL